MAGEESFMDGKITYIDGREKTLSNEIKRLKNFQKNNTIVTISIPPCITEIKGWSFHLCSNLKSVVLPNTLTEIGSGAFAYCRNLETIEVYSNLKSIGNYAFAGCPKLKIRFHGTIEQWRKICNDNTRVECYMVGMDLSNGRYLSETSDNIVCEENLRQSTWNDHKILYIYKNTTACHTRKHDITSATAIITGKNYAEIKLNVEYCEQCNRFYMSYATYEHYRDIYGILLGNLRMYSTMDSGGAFLASEYPLKLCCYSVSQTDGLSDLERQYIISQVIEKNILKKQEVIRYLEYFINMNGKKRGNEIAVSKWKADLAFTLAYKSESQTHYYISTIKKY